MKLKTAELHNFKESVLLQEMVKAHHKRNTYQYKQV